MKCHKSVWFLLLEIIFTMPKDVKLQATSVLKADVKVSRNGLERRSGKRIVAGTAFRLEFQVH